MLFLLLISLKLFIFIFIMYSSGLWKYDALTVAAFLLNVRLALHPINVLIAGVKNVVAGEFCPTMTEDELNLMPQLS